MHARAPAGWKMTARLLVASDTSTYWLSASWVEYTAPKVWFHCFTTCEQPAGRFDAASRNAGEDGRCLYVRFNCSVKSRRYVSAADMPVSALKTYLLADCVPLQDAAVAGALDVQAAMQQLRSVLTSQRRKNENRNQMTLSVSAVQPPAAAVRNRMQAAGSARRGELERS